MCLVFPGWRGWRIKDRRIGTLLAGLEIRVLRRLGRLLLDLTSISKTNEPSLFVLAHRGSVMLARRSSSR